MDGSAISPITSRDQADLNRRHHLGKLPGEESLGEQLSVTIIATGFKTRAEQGVETEREHKSAKTVHVLDQPLTADAVPAETRLSIPWNRF